MPAICEELAFRGFILSGFRRLGNKWRAIVYTAVLFGVTHLIRAAIADRRDDRGDPWIPGRAERKHPAGHGLPRLPQCPVVANSRVTADALPSSPLVRSMLAAGDKGGCEFAWPVVVAGALVGLLLLAWFSRLPCQGSPEESLQNAIGRGKLPATAPSAVEAGGAIAGG